MLQVKGSSPPEIKSRDNFSKQNGCTQSNKLKEIGEEKAERLSDFYKDKCIFITGVSGFIGKVFLIKLMSSLCSCKDVYVMLRPRKGQSARQRLDRLFNEEPFVSFEAKSKRPIDWSKVIPIEGDMSFADLGLKSDIKETVCNRVDIVFNIAASIRFNAPIKQNLRDNYLGTNNMIDFAMKLKRLISLVHVSTFFTNSHMSHIEEKIEPMKLDCEKLAELINWLPDQVCESIEDKLLEMDQRPNSYIYTKAMAENLIKKHVGRLPVAIVRPSIVIPSIRDPFPGWVDNINGPMGFTALISLGILRTVDWNYWGVCDYIPVDVVANTMLAVAERTPRTRTRDKDPRSQELLVYNCSSSSLNPLQWGRGFEIIQEEISRAPPYKMIRVPVVLSKYRRANPIVFRFKKMSELLFAYLIDFIMLIFGQRPILRKITLRLHSSHELLRPFTTVEYTCSNDNLLAAMREQHPDDREEFDFNIANMNWESELKDAYYGVRKWILNEDMSNIAQASFKYNLQIGFERLLKLIFAGSILWLSYRFYIKL